MNALLCHCLRYVPFMFQVRRQIPGLLASQFRKISSSSLIYPCIKPIVLCTDVVTIKLNTS